MSSEQLMTYKRCVESYYFYSIMIHEDFPADYHARLLKLSIELKRDFPEK